MSSLATTYASFMGLQTNREAALEGLNEQFFSVPCEKYITIQSSSLNQPAKNYDLFGLVLERLRPILNERGILIVQIGGKEDIDLTGIDCDLRGKTSIAQCNYLIKNSLAHIGVDSMQAHIAGANNIPLVELFGSTIPSAHGPYWNNQSKTIFLESHRAGQKPSFSVNEFPKTINFIHPEEVVRAVLKILDIQEDNRSSGYKTLYVGPNFNLAALELIPNTVPSPAYNPQLPITVRLDKHFDENVVLNVLATGRQINILTDKPLSKGFIQYIPQFRHQILSYNHELFEDVSTDYVYLIQRLIKKCTFYTRLNPDTPEINELRYKFFDHCFIVEVENKTREEWIKDALVYNNQKILDFNPDYGKMWFKTGKFILSNQNVYISHAHVERDIPIADASGKTINADEFGYMQVIDDKEFWYDMLNFCIIQKN